MRTALERSGKQPQDIKAIWAASAGHRLADTAEQAAIKRVFGDTIRVLTPKTLLGEPMGVGGSLNTALAVESWEHPDTDVAPVGPVLVNSSSLGGTHFSIVLAPYSE